MESAEIRPDLRPEITQVTGVKDLPISDAEAFAKRADPWMRAEPSPTSCVGKVLWMEGQATYANGLAVRRGQILKVGDTLQTSANGRVLFVAAPGVIAEIQPASTVRLAESTGNFQAGKLTTARAVLENPRGKAYISIIKGFGEKVQAEQGVIMKKETAPPARTNPEHALICGAPETVAARMAEIEATGVGGVICSFRLGPMTAEQTNASIRLFMENVAPRFGGRMQQAAE